MKKLCKVFICTVSLLFCGFLYAQSSPVPMLEQTANQILSTLEKNKSNLKNNKNIIYDSVKKNLLPIVDVRGMSRSVLGRDIWIKTSASDRKAFSKEFTRLVIRTYASPLAEYSGEKIKFSPVRGDLNKRFVKVNSVIVRNDGPNIPISYSLVSKKGTWKIYDISVEGVSLLQSFRSQFSQTLQSSNMQQLIADMRQHSQKAG